MNDEILSAAEERRKKKNAAQIAYYHRNKEKIAAYQKKRRETDPDFKARHRAYCKSYTLRNPEKRKESIKRYYDANRAKCHKAAVNSRKKALAANGEMMRAKQREYLQRNPEKWRAYRREYQRLLRQTRRGKVANKIRGRIHVLVRSEALKTKRTYVDSIAILNWFEWLREKQVVDWTQEGIDIDHVIPISAFNVKDEGIMRHVNKWWNLLPMTQFQNRSKGAKICQETFRKARCLAFQYINETRANTSA